jgi:hypothetical protein
MLSAGMAPGARFVRRGKERPESELEPGKLGLVFDGSNT